MSNCFDDSAPPVRTLSRRSVPRYVIRFRTKFSDQLNQCNFDQIYSDEAATTAEEWFAGTDAEPILVSLKVSNDRVIHL